MKRRLFLVTLLFLGMLLCCESSVFASEEVVGAVVSATGNTWAEREGQKSSLTAKSEILADDVLKTDKNSKMEIAFNDETEIVLGPSSEINVNEFVMTDTKNSFNVNIAKGAARVVTGRLVKRNPNGFKVTTPRSTIGIRGTTLAIALDGNNEIVNLLSLSGSHVTIINRGTGQRVRIDQMGYSCVLRGNQMNVVATTPKITAIVNGLIDDNNADQGGPLADGTVDDIVNEVSGGGDTSGNPPDNSEGGDTGDGGDVTGNNKQNTRINVNINQGVTRRTEKCE